MPLIQIQNVSKRYGAVEAVRGVSLDIHRGEFFALLGPSGCGKTTLLRLLAGFETPSRGRIAVAGADMAGIPPHKRPLNMMFQSYALFPHMTVAKNIAFGLRQQRMVRKDIDRRVDEMLRLVRLEGLAHRKPHQLSGGQAQRAALARALAKRPQVLLLDEPLAALDRQLREATRFELMEMHKRTGVTFVMVTHDQDEAMTVADRIAVMDRGTIRQVATPPDLYEQPNSRRVAEFVGTANIFAGRVVESTAASLRVRCSRTGVNITATRGVRAGVGTDVWVAVRPERIAVRKEPPAGADCNRLRGEVTEIGYLGNMSTYRVTLACGFVVLASEANSEGARGIVRREAVYLTWPADAGVVLDA